MHTHPAASLARYMPSLQGVPVGDVLPAMHSVSFVGVHFPVQLLLAAVGLSPYLPAGHSWQEGEARLLKEPAGQAVLFAPPEHAEPAGHKMHASRSTPLAYCPGGHTAHSMSSAVRMEPRGQGAPEELVAPATQ